MDFTVPSRFTPAHDCLAWHRAAALSFRVLMKVFLRYWLPLIVWMALIFTASGDAKSVQHTDGILAHLFRWLNLHVSPSQLETMRWIVRKGAHMTEYFILALLWWRALHSRHPAANWSARRAAIALLLCVLYAASDEFHQAFVKDRSPSVVDVGIDTFGASLAILTMWILTRRRQRQQPVAA